MKIIDDADLKNIVRGICKIMELSYEPIVTQKTTEELDIPAKAYYQKENGRSYIVLNIDVLCNAKDLLETLSHEMCHNYQQQTGGYYFTPDIINNAMTTNNEIIKLLLVYPKQQHRREVDAILFARYFIKHISKEFIDDLQKKMIDYVKTGKQK